MSNTPRNLNETCCKAQNYALEQSSKNLEKVVGSSVFLLHCKKKGVLRSIDIENIDKKQNPSDKVKILIDRIQKFPLKYSNFIIVLKEKDPTGQNDQIASAIETCKTEKEVDIAFQSLKVSVCEMFEILTGRKLNCHKYPSLTHIVLLLPDLINNLENLKNQKEAAENTKEKFEQVTDKMKEESEELEKLNQSQSERIQELEKQEEELKQQIQLLQHEVKTMKQAKESEITNRDNWIKSISRKACPNCNCKFTGLDSHTKTPERYDTKVTGSDNYELRMANDSQDQMPVYSQRLNRNAGTMSHRDIEEDANTETRKLKGKRPLPGEEDGSEIMPNQKIFTSDSLPQGTYQLEEPNENMDTLSTHSVSSIVTFGCSASSLSVYNTSSPSPSSCGIDEPRKNEFHVAHSKYVNINQKVVNNIHIYNKK